MSLAQIEYFVAVAEEGHVGRAARRLRIAQPAISRQIRRLEDELRAPLFRRTPQGMRLSVAGAIFLTYAKNILGSVQAARDAMLAAPAPATICPRYDVSANVAAWACGGRRRPSASVTARTRRRG